MHRFGFLFLSLSVGCGDLVSNPCQDYVDYVCACHTDNPELDCDTMRAAHSNAGVDQYPDCEVEHQALLELDEQLGRECVVGDTAG